jgi:polyisoprenoid-binding protein YceI
MIKNFAFLLWFSFSGVWAQAQYKPVDTASYVKFKIKNFGFSVNGAFTGLQGNIRFDPAQLGAAAFDVTVDAGTVNTDNSMRDDHLRKTDYFDAKNYPQIRMVSTRIRAANKANAFFMDGKVTIKKQTKDISFPFTATPSGKGWLFNGAFTINRRDFDVGGSSIISDKLDVSLNVVAN